MSGYTVNDEMAGSLQALAATAKTLVRIGQPAASPKRMRVWELEVSAASVPNATDCPIVADFAFCDATGGAITANGTSTLATPQPLDAGLAIGSPVDTAISLARVNFSAEPTTVAVANSWWYRAMNQRSGVMWQSQPGREILIPATVSVGPVLRALSPNYTGNAAARINFDEL